MKKLEQMYSAEEISYQIEGMTAYKVTKVIKKLQEEGKWMKRKQIIKVNLYIQGLISDGYSIDEILDMTDINPRYVEDFYIKCKKDGHLILKVRRESFKKAKEMAENDFSLVEILRTCQGLTEREIDQIRVIKMRNMKAQAHRKDKNEKEPETKEKNPKMVIAKTGADESNQGKDRNKKGKEKKDKSIEREKDKIEDIVEKLLKKFKKNDYEKKDLEKLRSIVAVSFMHIRTFRSIIKTLIEREEYKMAITLVNIKEQEDVFDDMEKEEFILLKKEAKKKEKINEIIKLLKKGILYPNEIANEVNCLEIDVIRVAREKNIPIKKRYREPDERF